MLTSDEKDDVELRTAIIGKLIQTPGIADLSLRVGVLYGIAHLTGKAPSLETWLLAAEVAGSIPGVRGVVNRIEAPGAPIPSRTINLQLDKKVSRQ